MQQESRRLEAKRGAFCLARRESCEAEPSDTAPPMLARAIFVLAFGGFATITSLRAASPSAAP